jgi:uncharacterized repeat protein (TIGR01451 family)
MSWYWALPAVAGLAFVMIAVLPSSSSAGNPGVPAVEAQDRSTPTFTPTATATVNPNCQLEVNKEVNSTTIPEDGQATYTITVKNEADTGHCDDLDVTDVIPGHTDCVSASVTDTNDLDFDSTDITHTCTHDDTVEWIGSGDLSHGDQVVLKMVVELTSAADKGDHISNTACATSDSDVGGDCDSVRFTVGAPVTATPTTAPTLTPAPTIPPVPTVIAPAPTARPLATIAPPVTGTGSGGGSSPLALALGLTGACLLLVSGGMLVKRAR